MIKISNLFGTNIGEFTDVRKQVETILNVILGIHESEYHGGDYFRLSEAKFNIVLKRNILDENGEYSEADFPDVVFLLYVNGESAKVELLGERLVVEGFRLLRSRKF